MGAFDDLIPQAAAIPDSATPAVPAFDDNYYSRLAQIESSNNPDAQNPDSSAAGLYQFTKSTGQQYGLSDMDRYDPDKSLDAVKRFTKDNKDYLETVLGREPTPGELYLAHQQGAHGAAAMLTNPDTPLGDLIGHDAAVNNAGDPSMRAGDFAKKWVNKFQDGYDAQDAKEAQNPDIATGNHNLFGDLIPAADNTTVANSQQSGSPETDKPGHIMTALQAGLRGAIEGTKSVKNAADPFKDRPAEQTENDYVGNLIQQPFSKGFKNPDWYVANMAHGVAQSYPSLGLGFAGGLAGGAAGAEITKGPKGATVGATVGGAAGFGAGGAMQEIAGSYQRARADGLDHDKAVDRAIQESALSGGFSALMGLAPGAKLFGSVPVEVEGQILKAAKKPISEALAQVFGVQPAIGAVQQAATAKLEGKDITGDDLATGYVQNAGVGVGMTAAHHAYSGARGMIGKPAESGEQQGLFDDLVPEETASAENAHTENPARAQSENTGQENVFADLVPDQDVSHEAVPEIKGKPSIQKLVTPRGDQEINSAFDVVDAKNLITSDHPDFPQILQPRDRTRKSSELQVNDIASKLDPARLAESRTTDTGAPIVGDDNIVESGNGRVMGIRQAYDQNLPSADNYRQFLEDRGYDTSGMEAPVLVRRRSTELSPEDRVKFTIASNERQGAAMSSTERAMADAKSISDDMASQYKGGDITSPQNRSYLKSFMSTIPETDRGAMIGPDGALSQDGIRRAKSALLAKAYDDSDVIHSLTEDPDSEIKSLGNAMTSIAGDVSSFRAGVEKGDIPEDLDVTPHIVEAAKLIRDARAANKPLSDVLSQGAMFEDHEIDPLTEQVVRAMYKPGLKRPYSAQKLEDFFRKYYSEAAKADNGPNLMGLSDITADDLIEHARPKEANEEPQSGLDFSQRTEETKPADRISSRVSGEPKDTSVGENLAEDQDLASGSQRSVDNLPESDLAKRATMPPSIRTGPVDKVSKSEVIPKSYHDENDLVKLRAKAQEGKNDLISTLKNVVKGIPDAKYSGVNLKKLGRIKEKVASGKQPDQISDYLRGRIVVDSPDAVKTVLSKLKKTGKVIDVDDKITNRPGSGYASVHVQFKGKNGLSSEIQITPREVAEVSDKTHELYEKTRNVIPKDEAESAEHAKHISEIRRLHDEAMQKFETRNTKPAARKKSSVKYARGDDQNNLSNLIEGMIAKQDEPGTRLGSSGVKFDAHEKNGIIEINRIFVPADMRNNGIATDMLKKVIDYADKTGQKIALSPSSDFGGNLGKLKKWYTKLGFNTNKGTNKDFTTKESFIREPKKANIKYSREDDQESKGGFYSELGRAADNLKQAKGSGDQMLGILRNTAGVKEDEIAWTGLDDYLKGKSSVSKQEIQDYLRDHDVHIKEVTLGGPDQVIERAKQLHAEESDASWESIGGGGQQHYIRDAQKELGQGKAPETKFSQYTIPGGKNYREVLLTLPSNPSGSFETYLAKYKERFPNSDYDEDSIRDFWKAGKTIPGQGEWLTKNDGSVYTSSHYDQPNILAHVRLNDRIDADGKKVLFVEEIQSDWHQAGRKRGYKGEPSKNKEKIDALEAELKPLNETLADQERRANSGEWKPTPEELAARQEIASKAVRIERKLSDIYDSELGSNKVPDAPFKKSWQEMAFRRVAQMAAQDGYDRVAWTTGEQQADRYDMSKVLNRIRLAESKDGQLHISAWDKENQSAIDLQKTSKENLPDLVGKEIAERLLSQEPDRHGIRELKGLDLKVGGSGMKGFYDNILVKYANKFGKKFGASVGETDLNIKGLDGDLSQEEFLALPREQRQALTRSGKTKSAIVHSMDITPEMRKSVSEGVPKFSKDKDTQEAPADAKRITKGLSGTELEKPNEKQKAIIDAVNKEVRKLFPEAKTEAYKDLFATGENGKAGRVKGAAWESVGKPMIAWSLEGTDNPVRVARHEVVHALKDKFAPEEWSKLEDYAQKKDWLKKYNIKKKYSDLDKPAQLEEAIADGVSEFRSGGLQGMPEPVRKVVAKIRMLLDRIKAAMRKMFGKDATAEDVISKFESGEIGRRPGKAEDKPVKFEEKAKNSVPLKTDTPEFKKWFGKSKVVDADGKPLVVYHGTDGNIHEFKKEKLGSYTGAPSSKEGFFFAGKPKTSEYYAKNAAKDNEFERHQANFWAHLKYASEETKADAKKKLDAMAGANILPVYLSMDNPLVHDMKGKIYRDESFKNIIAKAKEQGHDGVIIKNTYDGGERSSIAKVLKRPDDIYVAFEPEQIKSVFNKGDFNPKDSRINYARDDEETPKAEAPKYPSSDFRKRWEESRAKFMQKPHRAATITKFEVKKAQEEFIKLLEESKLKAEDKAKFIRSIKNVQTIDQLEKRAPVIQQKVSDLLDASERQKIKGQIRDLLASTKIRKQSGKPVGKFTPEIQKQLDGLRNIGRMIPKEAQAELEKRLASDGIPTPDEALENSLLAIMGHSNDLSPETMRDTLEALNNLKAEGAAGARARIDVRQERQAGLRQNARDALQTITADPMSSRKSIRNIVTKRWRKTASAFGSMYDGWYDTMDTVFGRDKTGAAEKLIEDLGYGVSDAFQNVKGRARRNSEDVVKRLLKAGEFQNENHFMKQLHRDSITKDLGVFENAAGKKVRLEMTKAEARKRWMEFQDPSLYDTLTDPTGNAYSPNMIKALDNFLTPRDKAMAKAQMDFYKDFYNQVNEKYRQIYGVDLPYNPHYSPISRQHNNSNVVDGFMKEMGLRRSTAPGGLKSRTANGAEIMAQPDISVLQRHIMEMSHFIEFADKIQDLNSVFGRGDIRRTIQDAYGPLMTQNIDSFIADFTKGGTTNAETFNTIDKLRANFTSSVLGLKPALAVKQMTSFLAYADTIPVSGFMKGFAHFIANPIKAARILDQSDMMKERGSNLERDMRDAILTKDFSLLRKSSSFKNAMMAAVTIGDRGSLIMGGYPLYYYHKNILGKTHEQALREFDRVTSQTQQSSDLDQLSRWQRGGSFAKLFTMFASSQNQFMRREIAAIRQGYRGKISKVDMAKKIALYHFVLPSLFQYVANFGRWDDKDQARAAILGSFNGMFIVGDVIDSAVAAMFGDHYFGKDLNIVQFINDTLEGIQKMHKADWGTDEMLNAIKELGTGLGEGTGYPVKQGFNIMEGMDDLDNGNTFAGAGKVLGWPPSVMDKAAAGDVRPGHQFKRTGIVHNKPVHRQRTN